MVNRFGMFQGGYQGILGFFYCYGKATVTIRDSMTFNLIDLIWFSK